MAAETKKRRLNPILAKELRLGSRSIKLPLAVMFYDLVLAVIAVIAIFIAAYASGSGTDYTGFLVIYQVIGWTQLSITLLIVPILTAGTISGEREKQTLEILLTTPKKPLSIIWGKLLSALSNYMLFIISSIPIMAIAFVLGGLNWFALLGYIVMMLVVVVYVGSVGVFCSSCFKKTIVSIVITFLIEGALLVIPFMLFGTVMVSVASIYEAMVINGMLSGTTDPNFGVLPMMLIGNPITGFFDYMVRSMDLTSIYEIIDDSGYFGFVMPLLAHAWIPMNVIASAAISWFFIWAAAKKLNPVKKSKRKKRRGVAAQPQPVMPTQAVTEPPQPVMPTQAVIKPPQAVIPSQEVGKTEELKRP